MNSVLATTLSSVYLAMRHIFPDVPISAGAFEPLIVRRPEGTFLDAKYPLRRMPTPISCPACSARLTLPDSLPAKIKIVRCPQCKGELTDVTLASAGCGEYEYSTS